MIKLQNDQIILLDNFNKRLIKIGQFLSNETLEIDRQLTLRVADVNDSMMDFEIDVELKYILHEDDPAYVADDDNILTAREFVGVFNLMETFDDWSDAIGNFGMKNHCWLFHDLYHHEYGEGQVALPFEDILRIGEIWVEIKPRHQYFCQRP
ncbi:MAG: hypothetical protein Q7T62_05470 [Undibacterium sp.]|nr:hypothetical protein [Undibacterium sp.]